jgi:hypothetical protein
MDFLGFESSFLDENTTGNMDFLGLHGTPLVFRSGKNVLLYSKRLFSKKFSLQIPSLERFI